MHQFFEAAGIALSGHLGQQAALPAHRARQHRRRDVDHRRGVARPGPERERQGRDPVAASAPTRSRCSRTGITRTDDEQLRAQSNPRVTLDDAAAIRRSSPSVGARHGASERVGTGEVPRRHAGQRVDPGRDQGIHAACRRPTSRSAGSRRRRSSTPGGTWPCSAATSADQLFGALDPIDKDVTINGVRFEVVGVATKKGSIFGNSQDEYAVIPLDAFQRIFGSRQSLQLTVRPRDPSLVQTAMDETTVALRVAAPAAAEAAGQLRPALVGHAPQHLQHRDVRHLRGADWRRQPLARRRRHRHHEHHADGRHRADARDRPAQVARRAAPRHPVADSDRVGHALDVRRHDGHGAGLPRRLGHQQDQSRCRRSSRPGRSCSASR